MNTKYAMNKICGGNGDTAKKKKKEVGFFRILRGCDVHSVKMEAIHEFTLHIQV